MGPTRVTPAGRVLKEEKTISHHSNLNKEVPSERSTRLWQTVQVANLPDEYYTYPNQKHFFVGLAWGLILEQPLAFLVDP
jgi:hypothetical protein